MALFVRLLCSKRIHGIRVLYRIAMAVCTMCVIMILQNNKMRKMCNGHLFAFYKRCFTPSSFSHCGIKTVYEMKTKTAWNTIVCAKWARSLLCLCLWVFVSVYSTYIVHAFTNQTIQLLIERWECIRISSFLFQIHFTL